MNSNQGQPSGTPNYQEIVSKNRYGIRNLQAQYLQNEYQKMQNSKNAERVAQLRQKERQHQMLNKLNETYINDVTANRRKKIRERESLSMQYSDFIRNHQEKDKLDKLIEKNIEKSTLVAPTWVRDVFAERETYKRNMDHYNKSLGDHVKLQQMRKEMEKEEELSTKKRIEQEAEDIIKKEYQYMEARHRQKSLFQKRQNELLGLKSDGPREIAAPQLHDKSTIFKRKEQDLYSQGLSIQLRKEQEKRYSTEKIPVNTSNVYNPITNPIPFVYKNPNVLRMMAQS